MAAAVAAAAAKPQAQVTEAQAPARKVHPPYAPSNPALDFCSPHFDAAMALAATDLPLPYPQVKALDNLAQCHYRMFAKAEREKHASAAEQRAAKDTDKFQVDMTAHPAFRLAREAEERRKQEEARQGVAELEGAGTDAAAAAVATAEPAQQRKQRKGRRFMNIIQRMEDLTISGPLSVLQRCCAKRTRVRVLVRDVSGIRGRCTGILEAWDKHFNLVLSDVVEAYQTVELRRKADLAAEQDDETQRQRRAAYEAKTRKAQKRARAKGNRMVRVEREACRRLPQLFVRGDSVAVVTEAGPNE